MTAMDLLLLVIPYALYIASVLHGYSYRIVFFNGNVKQITKPVTEKTKQGNVPVNYYVANTI